MFSMQGPFWRALNMIADIMILHFLWVIFSLPLVTIGASTTALYYAMMKRIRVDQGTIPGNFWKAFKENFKQSTIMWLIVAAFGVVVWLDLNFCMTWNTLATKVMLVGCALVLIPCWMTFLYLFPLQAKFTAPVPVVFKNALLISVRHLPMTLLLTVLWALVWLLLAIFPPFSGLMIICGAGLLAWVTSHIYIQVFRAYLPNEVKEDEEELGADWIHPKD